MMRSQFFSCPLVAVLLCAVALPAWGASEEEDTRQAEERAGGAEGESGTDRNESTIPTLAERIPSVTRRAFVQEGRTELFPTIGMSLNDPFFDNVIFNAGIAYHVFEWLAFGVGGDYFLANPTALSIFPGGAKKGKQEDLNRPTYSARLEAYFAPIYGKISLFAESVLHFDTYLIVGGGVVGLSDADPTVLGMVGIGQHYFIDRWLALRIELRDQLYSMARNVIAPKEKQLQNLLSFTLGVSFYLPVNFDHGAL